MHDLPRQKRSRNGTNLDRMTREQKVAYMDQEKEKLRLPNLFHDYDKSPKQFSNWEQNFMSDIQGGYRRGYIKTIEDLSEKQQLALERIEAKVYNVG